MIGPADESRHFSIFPGIIGRPADSRHIPPRLDDLQRLQPYLIVHLHGEHYIGPLLFNHLQQSTIQFAKIPVTGAIPGFEMNHFMSQTSQRRHEGPIFGPDATSGIAVLMLAEYTKHFHDAKCCPLCFHGCVPGRAASRIVPYRRDR